MSSNHRGLSAVGAAALILGLSGCAATTIPPPPPAVLVACEVDVTALYRCVLPPLPDSPAEGLILLVGTLRQCEIAAKSVIEQVERR